MKWHIASVSWGKDSLAMLLMLIAKGYPLNEVVFYDTGMEFEAIYHIRDQMLPRLEQLGIKYTRLEPENPFLFDMLERPVCSKQKGTHQGYGWCGGLCRWGTTGKLKAIDRYAEARDAMVYVGIAADETPRLEKERKPYKLHPLAEWVMPEADALAYCYENGFSWLEGTIRLYDVLDRVSCWCCCNKNLRELRNMCIYLPEYWERRLAADIISHKPYTPLRFCFATRAEGRKAACIYSGSLLSKAAPPASWSAAALASSAEAHHSWPQWP